MEYLGVREDIEDFITVHYSTKDGSAIAGEDYIAIEGIVTLYNNQTSAIIAVEILGDKIFEEEEHFYMEVSSPSHGNFAGGVETLIAKRTIFDDDNLL